VVNPAVAPGLAVLANNDPVQRNGRNGKPMNIAGTKYTRGLYCHAVSKVVVRLPGKGKAFNAAIGVDSNEQTRGGRGSVEFIVDGLTALHAAISDGIRVRGYVHWSLLDNFEWAAGYGPKFGLIGVDRATQERTVRPSARLLGEIARTSRLTDAQSAVSEPRTAADRDV